MSRSRPSKFKNHPESAAAKRQSAGGPIPFSGPTERLDELFGHDARIQKLRKQLEEGADAGSVARTAALFYVDLLGRLVSWSHQWDEATGGRLFLPGLSIPENVRRAKPALILHERLMAMQKEVIDGLLSCLGGERVLAIDAVLRLTQETDGAQSIDPKHKEMVDQLIRNVLEKAANLK